MSNMALRITLPDRAPDFRATSQQIAPGAGAAQSFGPPIAGRWVIRWRLSNGAAEANHGFFSSNMAGDPDTGTVRDTQATPAEGMEFSHVLATDVGVHTWNIGNVAAGGAGVAYAYTVDAWFQGV